MLPVVVGAIRTIPNATKEGLKEIEFSKIETSKFLRKLQNNYVGGIVKICKMFTKYSESWCIYMVLTDSSWIPPNRQFSAKICYIKKLKHCSAGISFKVVWTDFEHVIVCFVNDIIV